MKCLACHWTNPKNETKVEPLAVHFSASTLHFLNLTFKELSEAFPSSPALGHFFSLPSTSISTSQLRFSWNGEQKSQTKNMNKVNETWDVNLQFKNDGFCFNLLCLFFTLRIFDNLSHFLSINFPFRTQTIFGYFSPRYGKKEITNDELL